MFWWVYEIIILFLNCDSLHINYQSVICEYSDVIRTIYIQSVDMSEYLTIKTMDHNSAYAHIFSSQRDRHLLAWHA